MRKARIQGTLVPPNRKPKCRDCDHSRSMVKYMGRWVCKIHLKVKNTRVKSGPFGEQIIFPTGIDTPFNMRPEWSFGELFVNRQHRRSVGHTRALG